MSDFVVLKIPVFSSLCNLGFALRRAVFVVEQKIPEAEEFDANDLTAAHWVAVDAGEVVGTLRVIAAPEHTKIGRIVVHADWRGRGVARAMITAALDERRAAGISRFHLDAQADKIALYEKFGFTAYGEEFLDGGLPHRAMRTY